MRWRRCGRRAISTMIAGIIVLTLLLTALGTMIFVTQQYDAYQSILNTMSQKDTERFSENIAAVYPGIFPSAQPVTCGGTSCNQYTLALSNDGPIEVQIARIYINSTTQPQCARMSVYLTHLIPQPRSPTNFKARRALSIQVSPFISLHFGCQQLSRPAGSIQTQTQLV